MLTIKRKVPTQYALEVKGRTLAPMMHVIDNVSEIEEFMNLAGIPCENWSLDERIGAVVLEGIGLIRIGEYAVLDYNGGFQKYEDIDALRTEYEIVR